MIEQYIKEKEQCTGCHSCSNICVKQCISMELDEEGFWYPKVDKNQCINCGKCIFVCPLIQNVKLKNQPAAFACMNQDENIRTSSSSGGIFSVIAQQVLENCGIVFGAAFNKDFQVEHSYIESQEQLGVFRGSKYVQSKIGNSYNQTKIFLEQGRQVLFTGTPCQIGGLKSFLSKPYDNLFCMDIICHGVPSPNVWKKYLKYQKGKYGDDIKTISFRNKKEGWYNFGTLITFENNKSYYKSVYKDLFMRAFLKDVCLRPSCYKCNFKTLHRQSDITLADFWGIQNVLPEMDDNKGTSLIFVNTKEGHAMLEEIKDKIVCKEVDVNQAAKHNPAAIESAPMNPNRNKFFRELDKRSFDQLVYKYCLDKLYIRVIRKMKGIIGK